MIELCVEDFFVGQFLTLHLKNFKYIKKIFDCVICLHNHQDQDFDSFLMPNCFTTKLTGSI